MALPRILGPTFSLLFVFVVVVRVVVPFCFLFVFDWLFWGVKQKTIITTNKN